MAVSIKWIPYHSWFRLNIDGIIIHIDPTNYKAWQGVKTDMEEKADIILVTHSHSDHCEPVLIDKLSRVETNVFAADCCKQKLKSSALYMAAGDEILINKITIRATEAYNTNKNYHPKGFGIGFLVSYGGKTVYHAGDTDLIPEMAELGKVDVALLPVGGTYTMTLPEAAKAVSVIKPDVVIPMHKLDTNPEDLRELIENETGTKLVVLKPGEEYFL